MLNVWIVRYSVKVESEALVNVAKISKRAVYSITKQREAELRIYKSIVHKAVDHETPDGSEGGIDDGAGGVNQSAAVDR